MSPFRPGIALPPAFRAGETFEVNRFSRGSMLIIEITQALRFRFLLFSRFQANCDEFLEFK